MNKKTSIPVNHFGDEFNTGISIEKMSIQDLPVVAGIEKPERHDRHSFFLIESGTITIEIDFQQFKIKPSTIIYIHPDQVHRITAFKNVTVSCLAINNESLNPEYLKLLEELTPVKPLPLKKEELSIIVEVIAIAIKFSKRTSDKQYHSTLKDLANALVAMLISQYLEQDNSKDKRSRFDNLTKAFKELLEQNFTSKKSPAEYAEQLNISPSYLNECVKNTTGHSVSHHIQQRVILEAKRLLYHSQKSVKEIAAELGFDDYPYFSRLFTKVTGMNALAFRNKNHE